MQHIQSLGKGSKSIGPLIGYDMLESYITNQPKSRPWYVNKSSIVISDDTHFKQSIKNDFTKLPSISQPIFRKSSNKIKNAESKLNLQMGASPDSAHPSSYY
jgi:hypothetical protein